MNKAIILGNLGADPESRTTQSGSTVTTLRIATNERVKKGDQWEDHTEWHRVVCFGRTAENASRFLQKGRQVLVEGKIRTRKYTDKDGAERVSTEIIADNVQFIGGKGEGDSRSSAPRRDNYGSSGPDDDLPF